MTTARGGLGRGLGALIPSGPGMAALPPLPAAREAHRVVVDPPGGPSARYAELPVDAIVPNPRQPRVEFDEQALAELVSSVREVGLLQPVVVRETAPQRYELVMGERRWRAAREAGLAAVPAIVRVTDDDAMLRDALLENLHRQQLNPLEEAAAYEQLLREFGATHEQLATRLGRSRPQISNTIRLLQLPAAVQRRVAAGVLSAGHARAVLGLPTAQAQEQMATRVVAEGLSVRGVEEAVAVAVSDAAADPDADPQAPVRRRPAGRPVPPGLTELGDRLADRLDTRVTVGMGRAKGKVTIEFASLPDLERIVGVLEGTGQPDP